MCEGAALFLIGTPLEDVRPLSDCNAALFEFVPVDLVA